MAIAPGWAACAFLTKPGVDVMLFYLWSLPAKWLSCPVGKCQLAVLKKSFLGGINGKISASFLLFPISASFLLFPTWEVTLSLSLMTLQVLIFAL